MDSGPQQLKPPPRQPSTKPSDHKESKHLLSAIRSHAGKQNWDQMEPWRSPAMTSNGAYSKSMADLYQKLKQNREKERKDAIRNGSLADPDKPTSLAHAITPVGTCQNMCPEFERVERIVQLMVDSCEKVQDPRNDKTRVPCEPIMVKRFRRSAAGYDEQLPSDIRPPAVLQKTLNYLFDEVIGGPEPLKDVHKFVWDRTRGIRNDFSIQQVTKTEDLKMAIDCFERIARFHILSLHQLSRPGQDDGFDHHQEREQLNNTLLSLMYYYDDSRHKLTSPNEAEFRAYCIIFEIQDQRPDLEDRAQNWPRSILKDQRVQTALKLYAAAGNTSDEQGPLRPRARFAIAQANTGGFWKLIESNAVPYVMACVAEIYFNLVRRVALEAIWKAYKGKRGGPTKMEDWTLKDLTPALGLDDEEQTREFCEEHGFAVFNGRHGEPYVDLGSVPSGDLTDQNPRRKQIFSRNLVEFKRLRRTFPAVINGLTASEARSQGFVESQTDTETASEADSESLFIDGDSDHEAKQSPSGSASPDKRLDVNGDAPKLNPTPVPFNPFTPKPSPFQNSTPLSSISTFGKPSSAMFSPQGQAVQTPSSDLNPRSTNDAIANQFGTKNTPKFDFFAAAESAKKEESKEASVSTENKPLPKFDFFAPSVKRPVSTEDTNKSSTFAAASQTSQGGFGKPSPMPSSVMFTEPKPITTNQFPQFSSDSLPLQTNGIQEQPTSTLPRVLFGASPSSQDSKSKNHVLDDKLPAQSSLGRPNAALSPQLRDMNQIPNQLPLTDSSPSLFSTGPLTTVPTFANPTGSILFPTTEPSKVFSSSPLPDFTTTAGRTIPAPNISRFPATSASSVTSASPQQESLFPDRKAEDPRSKLISASATSSSTGISPVTQQSANLPRQTIDFSITHGPSAVSSSAIAEPTSAPEHSPLSTSRDSESLALDKLASAMMLEDEGLLQNFIEYTIEPIITSSIAQLEDEWSWEEARENRVVLLSKKYGRRWRTNAWKIGLRRKGRERRKNFARSIQQVNLNASLRASISSVERPFSRHGSSADTMPPPATPSFKRQILPTDLEKDPTPSENTTKTKRKREGALVDVERSTPQRRTKIHHYRSHTIGDSIMSTPPDRVSRTPFRSSMDFSQVPKGSMLEDTLMRQARKLAPNAKADTTQTDYFRLKALGLDPDTPIVPISKKRTRAESDDPDISSPSKHDGAAATQSIITPKHQASQPIPKTLPHPSLSEPPRKRPAYKNDEDEVLFAQLRSVREALADSEQWMQTERERLERSVTPRSHSHFQSSSRTHPNTQSSTSPPTNESPAQRRLREIREKGHTPSRTEIRLRAMGDKALLPKGFWDGEGMGRSLYGKGKGKGREVTTTTNLRTPSLLGHGRVQESIATTGVGLRAFAEHTRTNGLPGVGQWGVDESGGEERQEDLDFSEESSPKKGASAEDAIEL